MLYCAVTADPQECKVDPKLSTMVSRYISELSSLASLLYLNVFAQSFKGKTVARTLLLIIIFHLRSLISNDTHIIPASIRRSMPNIATEIN